MYTFARIVAWIFLIVILGEKRMGMDRLPADGPILLVSNHVHLLDPFAVGICCKRHVHFMAKKELFQNKALAKLLRMIHAFPVDRGAMDRQAVRHAIEVLSEGKVMGMFPEGTRNKGEDNQMLPVLNGAAMFALKSGAPVYPAYISGKYRPFGKLKVSIGPQVDLDDLKGLPINRATMDEATKRICKGIENAGK